MNLFGLIFVRWKALVDSERKKLPNSIWLFMSVSHMRRYGVCELFNKQIECGFFFWRIPYFINVCFSAFCFHAWFSIVAVYWTNYYKRREKKNQRPHIKINDFYLETKRLPIRLEIVECAIRTVFICETHQNRSHSNEVICVIPQ